jgi:hypothetical protein
MTFRLASELGQPANANRFRNVKDSLWLHMLASRMNKLFGYDNGSDHSLGFVYYAGIFVLAGNSENVTKGLARAKKARIERLGSGWIRDLCRLNG